MAGISGKLSNLKYMRGAGRSDTRRQKSNKAEQITRRAWLRASRREGKKLAKSEMP